MDVVAEMDTPEGKQKLAPLQSALDEKGSSTPAKDILVLAQKVKRAAGKSPQELADMIRQDESLVSDIENAEEAVRMKDEMGLPAENTEETEPPAEPSEEETGKMKGFLEETSSMKAADPKAAAKAAKGKSPRTMGFDQKADFMSEMAPK